MLIQPATPHKMRAPDSPWPQVPEIWKKIKGSFKKEKDHNFIITLLFKEKYFLMNLQNHSRLRDFFFHPPIAINFKPWNRAYNNINWFPKGCRFALVYQLVFRITPYRFWRCLRENRLNAACWIFSLLKKKLYLLTHRLFIISREKNFWSMRFLSVPLK